LKTNVNQVQQLTVAFASKNYHIRMTCRV